LGASVALSLFCVLELKPPNMLFCVAAGSLGVSVFCAFVPKPLKMLFCAGTAGCAEPPNPLKGPLVADVLTVFWADVLAAPKLKGVDAGAEVLVAFGAPLVVPKMPLEGAELAVPKMLPEVAELVVLFWPNPPKGLLCD
jgi:hypothetical protein